MSQATLSGGYHNSNLFSNTYLDSQVQQLDDWECDTQAEISLRSLQGLWERESDAVSAYNEDSLIKEWIEPVLEVLGYETLSETSLPSSGGYVDRLLLGSDGDRRDAAKLQSEGDLRAVYGRGLGILEAKQWDADFEVSLHREGNYRDASQQIKHYLERTPGSIQWGILTDGKKWRLYGTKDYQTKTYYEVDLPELIENGSVEAFKRFFAFFRAEALHDYGGSNFLETVYAESETAAQELGEDLQDQVFTALRVLGRGLVETNDLDVGSADADDVSRDELKEQSLVLLYRLMFLLYAESRQLINPDDPRARQQYQEAFSLEHLRDDVLETLGEEERFDYHYNEYATGMWTRLTDLFGLVDTGNEDLGIPPYNGGLFDDEDHSFLAVNEVNDRYLAEVIYRISTTTDESGEVVRADYGDLDTRHLGSIYEGLLEHQFTIAEQSMAAVREDGGQSWVPATDVSAAEAVEVVEAGDLYVVNDDGERKATGAYYTPDYVVTYIVEETVDPLVEEIREELRAGGFDRHGSSGEYVSAFASRITDLKILDPAMGSGHFLTKATGYLTRQILDEAAALGVGGTFKEDHVRRQVAKECIYGVDLNEMAVELAKLSMWLETLAADQPLAFLDHHLKAGNSLVGSDIEEIEGLESDTNGDSGQSSLAEFGATREGTIERLMEIYGEFLAIENEDLDDVKEMERKYAQIQEDDLRKRLVAMANVRTAEDFGLDVSTEGDRNPYEWMASALESDEEWATVEERGWFRSAQALADEQEFFHWKLEFPEVFYDDAGKKTSDSGFDVVAGNPPWVDIKGLKNPEILYKLFDSSFNRVNIYSAFFERSDDLIRDRGQFGFITPTSFMTQSSYKPLRTILSAEFVFENFVRLPDNTFKKVTMETVISVMQKREAPADSVSVKIFDRNQKITDIYSDTSIDKVVSQRKWENSESKIFDIFTSESERDVLDKIRKTRTRVADKFETSLGLTPYDKHQGHSEEVIDSRDFHSDTKESPEYRRVTTGVGIRRYTLTWEGGEWIHYGEWLGADREERFFVNPRVVVRQIVSGGQHSIKAAYSSEEMFHTQVGFVLLPKDGSANRAKATAAVLNSTLLSFYHTKEYLDENKDTFQKILIQDCKEFPLPSGANSSELINAVDNIREKKFEAEKINLHLPDYLTTYSDGPTLADRSSPPEGLSQTLLTKSLEDTDRYEKLRIDSVDIDRAGDDLTLSVVPYVKPVEAIRDEYETNSHGYTTLDPIPAMEFRGLDGEQADLIESFVPYAVAEAGGFAGFRDGATKTITPLDRLESLTLPALADVRGGLADYREAVAEAEELDEKIERTDDLIDEIVYDLYGLTDEEIEIVEEAVGGLRRWRCGRRQRTHPART